MSKIRLKLKKGWGGFHAGDEVNFDESKGRDLVNAGKAIEIPAYENDVLLPNKIQEKSNSKKIRLKLTKNWGGYYIDDMIMFDESKAQTLIEGDFGVEVPAYKYGKLIPNKINKRAGDRKIKVKFLKNWATFFKGETLNLGIRKADGLISEGYCVLANAKSVKDNL